MRIEVLTGPERRRRWSDEEKLRIIREAMQPGVRYADVARRHDISPPQLYQCRVALREGRLVDPGADLPGFIEVRQDEGVAPCVADAGASRASIEIVTVCGRVLRSPASLPSSELRRLIRAVEGA
jgi:transposase-like protein